MSFFLNRLSKNKYNLTMLSGFIAGSIIANILFKLKTDSFYYDYEALLNMLNAGINKQVLFFYIFKRRVEEYSILILLMMIPFKAAVPILCVFEIGIDFGIVLSSMIVNWGIKGILLFCASILPHYAVYIMTASLVIKAFRLKDTRKTVINIIFGLILLMAGCYFETAINPYFVQFVLNKFCDVI